MRTLVTIVGIFFFFTVTINTHAAENTQPTIDSSYSMEPRQEVPLQQLPIRSLSSKDGSRLFLECSGSLKDVAVEIQCTEGHVYLTYEMPVLTDVDLSLGILPEGNYRCFVKSKDGLYSSELRRYGQ